MTADAAPTPTGPGADPAGAIIDAYAAATAALRHAPQDRDLLIADAIGEHGGGAAVFAILASVAEQLRRISEVRRVDAGRTARVLTTAFGDVEDADALTRELLEVLCGYLDGGPEATHTRIGQILASHPAPVVAGRAVDLLSGAMQWRASDQDEDPVALAQRVLLRVAARRIG